MNTLTRIFITFSMITVVPLAAVANDQSSNLLFSDETANLIMLTDEEFAAEEAAAELGSDKGEEANELGGPEIKIIKPRVTGDMGKFTSNRIDIVSPAELQINFIETKAEVNMSSVRVCGMKVGVCVKDLTDEVRMFISENSIQATGLEVPAIKFKLRLEIKDVEGTKTTESYLVNAEKKP